ncbi:MAG: helix-turn-helix transcriptional regulator [Lentisphaeria bacterium]|jgi:AraC-like DNA-binding protein
MPDPPTKYEWLLRSLEEQLQVRLTVHDELGLLRDGQGALLLPGRNFHPHPYCAWRRNTNRSVDRKCYRHCVVELMRRIRTASDLPLETCCWKGVRELVVPVYCDGRHTLTVFIGAFRQTADTCPLPGASAEKMFLTLPVDTYQRFRQLTDLVRFFFLGVLHSLTEQRSSGERSKSTRRQQIEQFIHQNASRNGLNISDLARKLHLSTSRTAHLVLEECGISFCGLLTNERLLRAKTLLLTENLSIGEIAEHTGFGTASYFCRVFKKRYDISPASFRAQKRDDAR